MWVRIGRQCGDVPVDHYGPKAIVLGQVRGHQGILQGLRVNLQGKNVQHDPDPGVLGDALAVHLEDLHVGQCGCILA